MINLLKNEYIKVFKKKGFIILLIILLSFTVLTNFLYKIMDNFEEVFDNDSYIEQYYEMAKTDYENNKDSRDSRIYREEYVQRKIEYDSMKYRNQFEKDSWQRAYLRFDDKAKNYITTINSYEISKEGSKEEYESAKSNLDKYYEKLKSIEWQDLVKEEKKSLEDKIKKLDEQIKKVEESPIDASKEQVNDESSQTEIINLNNIESEYEGMTLSELKSQRKIVLIEIELIDLQLEKNISFSDVLKYEILSDYTIAKTNLVEYDNKDINKLTKEQKESYYDLRKEYFNAKYKVDNINSNVNTNSSSIFSEFYDNYLLMIVIFIFLITGPIVSQEFSKGTIKLLLCKPYSRAKILLSKYIVSLSSILMAMVIMYIFQSIIGGLFFGFDSLSSKIVVYSNVSDSAHYMSIIKYFTLVSIAKLPYFIILATLTFAVSAIFNNTAVAIITGIVGYIGSNIVTLLLGGIDKPWVKFFIGFNWDFKPYIFNLKPEIKGIDLTFSCIICIAYLLVLIIPSFIVFKRKDIKNI